jgi:DNA-binding transcriptional LysR family regulator
LAKRKKINGAELSNFEMILLRRGSGIRDELDRAFETNGIQLNVVNETSQILTLLGLVEAGLGVTVLPSMLCPDPAHGAVAVIPIQKPSVQRKLGLIFATAREPSAAAKLLADVVLRTVASAALKVPAGVSKLV